MNGKTFYLNQGSNGQYGLKTNRDKALTLLISLTFCCFSGILNAQISCNELMEYVVSKDYGYTYYSSDSEAITKVSFHEIRDDSYNTNYYAVVQFTSSFKKYIYQVDSRTRFNYSLNYLTSAGEAFWKYIHPYRKVLGCAPNFE
jgi:hypothetical protein